MAQALTVGPEVGIDGWMATRDHILELAELAKSSGVESLWVADDKSSPSRLNHAEEPKILSRYFPRMPSCWGMTGA